MAERTLKIADRDDFAADDPLAELTRIMGFDPRQPVRREEPVEPAFASDFDIDLEKELMGEFNLDADHDDASARDPRAFETAPTNDDELDEVVAASMQDFDLSVEDHASRAAAPEVEFDRDFDDALTRSFDAGEEWPQEEAAVAPVSHEEAAPAVEVEALQDFDARFEAAMAEADLDFDHEAEAPLSAEVAASGSAGDEHEAETGLEVEAAAMEVAADPFEEAFSLDIDEAPAVEPVAPAAVSPAAGGERSLEDELNALLGNMGARIARPEGAPVAHAWASSDRPRPAADPFAVAAVGYGAHQPSAAAYPQPVGETAVNVAHAAEAAAGDVDFDLDTGDFENLAVEAEPQHEVSPPSAPAASASIASIFSRSWSRATPAQPAPAEPAPQLAAIEEPALSDEIYQPEPEPAFQAAPQEAAEDEETEQAGVDDDIPDVETVDVPERVEALADDLDLPELEFEEDRPAPAAFDDLEAEFSHLLSEMGDTDMKSAAGRSSLYDDEPYEAGFKRAAPQDNPPAHEAVAGTAALAALAVAPHGGDFDPASSGMRPFAPAESFDADSLDYDPELEEEIAIPGPEAIDNGARPGRRGLLAAAVAGAVVVLGGIGAFVLLPGGGENGAPVLVKADDAPIKVKPENPGGTVVPNQDNKVYEAVTKGVQSAAPEQQELVADTQQPVNVNTAAPQNRVVDLSPDESEAMTAGDTVARIAKSEERIDPATQEAAVADTGQDTALVSPRKVRTMIVKPDGTLAPREDATPAVSDVAATEPADPAPQRVVSGSAVEDADQTGTVAAAADAVEAGARPAAKAKANAQSPTTPQTVAAAPQRPSDQPVDVVGEVKPDQVASISSAAAASGSWSMQIASQPSAEAAQSTYNDLARRYASVLQGQPVSIVKAEIAGKGTFYRVRVPANSRNDAIKLCESYKAAGGNCFVSK